MNVLVVDDEAFVRVNFKLAIDWEGIGYRLIGEARHGREALEKIVELKPDIVFLDIRMPVLDGIEVMRKLREQGSPCKVIVLSNHNEFEYVREAMRLGALDYIHKLNMNPDGVLDTLGRIREVIVREREQSNRIEHLSKNVEIGKSSMRDMFCKEWVEGVVRHPWEIESKIEQYGIGIKQPNVACLLMVIDQFAHVKKRYKDNMKHLLGFSIQNVTREVIRKYEEIEFFQIDEKTYCIIKSYSGLRSMSDMYAANWELIRTMKTTLKQFLNIGVSFGVSGLHERLLKVPVAYAEAMETVQSLFFEGADRVVTYGQQPAGSGQDSGRSRQTYKETLTQLRLVLEREQFDELESAIDRLFLTFKEYRDVCRHDILDMSLNLHHLLHDRNVHAGASAFPTIEQFMEAENLDQLRLLLRSDVESLRGKPKDSGPAINYKIKMVLDYIHRHYDRDLTLEDLSQHVELNGSYLSRLFKEQTGMMLVPYINQYRVKKSVDYLKNSSMKTYEIAEKVGFRSIDNYYVAFKKIYGQPPNEYRKKWV